MAWPNKEYHEKLRKEFDAGGGPEFVRGHFKVLPSVDKREDNGEPWPAFHRCMICGQHPEVMGENCIKVGRHHETPYCEYCVTEMYNALKNGPKP